MSKVKLTYNTGYSTVVEMSEYTFNYYMKERHRLTYRNNHSIDYEYNGVGISFNGLVRMEEVKDIVDNTNINPLHYSVDETKEEIYKAEKHNKILETIWELGNEK